jgi:heat shock protein HslJ
MPDRRNFGMMTRITAVAIVATVLACGPAAEDAPKTVAATAPDAAQPPAPASIPSHLIGREWRLTHFDRTEAVPDQVVITLKFEEEKISGSAGCNRYFATVTEGDRPGEITIGEAGATRMACPEEIMNAESRFLHALSNVARYELAGERLALTYREEEGHHVLLLTPIDAGS